MSSIYEKRLYTNSRQLRMLKKKLCKTLRRLGKNKRGHNDYVKKKEKEKGFPR